MDGLGEDILDYLENFVAKNSLFLNKKVLYSDYTPENLEHRGDLVQQIVEILAPVLRQEKPSNLFLFGKTGTGKTVAALFTTAKLKEVATKKNVPLQILYVNCKLGRAADTEYRVISEFVRLLGGDVPTTGLPTQDIYQAFYKLLDDQQKTFIFILDEIDQLVKKIGDEVFYSLVRMNTQLKKSQVSFVGISNDIMFVETLDPRIKSSLSEEEILFPPYNAVQLQDILSKRAEQAFNSGVLKEGVIQKCAAFAARDHGDARRALDLLRIAGELAERKGLKHVDMTQVDEAENKIEKDKVLESIRCQPKQFQVVLYAIILIHNQQKDLINTGDVYELYSEYCGKVNLRPLTQRRVSDIISELDLLGIILAKTVSKGRYGRTRSISFSIPPHVILKLENFIKEKLEV